MGVGFAIPIDLAKGIADQLMDSDEVTRGYLGFVIQELTPELAKSFDLDQNQGILIAQVTEDSSGSPAAEAGLKQGDIIVAYQGKPVTKVGNFRNRVSLTSPGNRQQLTIIRDSERRNAKAGEGVVVTQVRPDSIAASAGIQSGSIIVQVNRIPMTSAEDFKRELKKSSASKRIRLLIRKNNMQQFVALSW